MHRFFSVIILYGCSELGAFSELREEPFRYILVEFPVDDKPKTVTQAFTLSESGYYAISYHWNKDGPYPDLSQGIPKSLMGVIEILDNENNRILTHDITLPSISAANGMDLVSFNSKALNIETGSILTFKMTDIHLSSAESNLAGVITFRLFKRRFIRS